jgi:hypothetical protein
MPRERCFEGHAPSWITASSANVRERSGKSFS